MFHFTKAYTELLCYNSEYKIYFFLIIIIILDKDVFTALHVLDSTQRLLKNYMYLIIIN